MTSQIHRLYKGEKAEDTYFMSIVVSDTDARYVVPSQKLDISSTFNNDRIKDLVLGMESSEVPTTSEGWLELATYNVGRYMVLSPTAVDTSEDMEALLEEEQAYADANAEKYAYLEEL